MAIPNSYVKTGVNSTGVLGLTGAAPQSGNGKAVVMANVATDTLAARVYALATTNTLTITGKWQVLDDDGSTWIDCRSSTNAAQVILVTGTGSAVTLTASFAAPNGVYGRKQARFVVTSGVGVGGGAAVDEYSIAYDYRIPSFG